MFLLENIGEGLIIADQKIKHLSLDFLTIFLEAPAETQTGFSISGGIKIDS